MTRLSIMLIFCIILINVFRLCIFNYLLDVLICCQAAVADLITDLGSNVSINCDLDENDVYWILLKTADPPTVILQSFSTTTSPFYPNKTFRKKYSVQFKHLLVINNVTADELGVYYCMNTETPPKLSNSTRIYFNGELICYLVIETLMIDVFIYPFIICYSLLQFCIHFIIAIPLSCCSRQRGIGL